MGRTRAMVAAACVVAVAIQPATAGAASKPRLFMSTPAVGVLKAGSALLVQVSVVAPSPSGGGGESCTHPAEWTLLSDEASSDRIGGSTEDFACAPERMQSIAITLTARGKVSVRAASPGTRLVLSDPSCEWDTTALTGTVALPAAAESISLSGTAHKGVHAASSCASHAHVHGSLSLLTTPVQETVWLEAH